MIIKKINRLVLIIPILTILAVFMALNNSNRVFASEASEINNAEDHLILRHPGMKDEYSNDDLVSLNQLPVTGFNKPAPVLVDIVGNTVRTDIFFNDKHHLYIATFEKGTDFDMFNSKDMLYINDGLKGPQIFINLDDERMYLAEILSVPEDERPAFVPHTIWHMKTGEVETILTYDSYLYIESEGGVFYGYYYTEDFVIDEILMMTLEYYTQTEVNPFWSKRYMSDPELQTFFYDKTDSNGESTMLTYKNKTSNWFHKYFPIVNLVEVWSKGNFRRSHEVPKIQEYTDRNPVLMNKMSNHFDSLSKDFDRNTFGNKKIFKLALGEANDIDGFFGWMGEKTHIYQNQSNLNDPFNAKVITLQYRTNGKIYVSKGSDINLYVGVGKKIDAIHRAAEMKKGTSFMDNIKKTVKIIVVITSVTVGIIAVGAITNSVRGSGRDRRRY